VNMRKIKIILVALALILTATAVIGTASAYFTTHSAASGMTAVSVKPTVTTITETVDPDDMEKIVSITNEEGAPCYVRVQAFASGDMTLGYDGENWSDDGSGYVTYGAVLEAGETTTELVITIGNVPEDAEEGATFNVIVVYESTYVSYDDDGEPLEPVWDRKAADNEGGQD